MTVSHDSGILPIPHDLRRLMGFHDSRRFRSGSTVDVVHDPRGLRLSSGAVGILRKPRGLRLGPGTGVRCAPSRLRSPDDHIPGFSGSLNHLSWFKSLQRLAVRPGQKSAYFSILP